MRVERLDILVDVFEPNRQLKKIAISYFGIHSNAEILEEECILHSEWQYLRVD